MDTVFLPLGALLGSLAVAVGAFGSHALQQSLTPQRQNTFEIGVRYQFYHAIALLVVGIVHLLQPDAVLLSVAGWLFTAGILCFCGSLYWLALGGPRWLGPVTPLGGLAFIAGWLLLAVALL